MNPLRWLSRASALCLAVALGSCGGGGGGGLAGGGIGGTGISTGPIAGFGSVIIGEQKYELRARTCASGATAADCTQIVLNGVEGRLQDDLRLGMVVSIDFTTDSSGTRTADKIVYSSDVQGIVSGAPNLTDNTVSVLGQIIQVDESTCFQVAGGGRDECVRGAAGLATITASDTLEVSGLSESSGRLRATRIERRGSGSATVELRGSVKPGTLSPTRFQINDQVVDYSAARVEGTLAESAQVEVRGIVTAGVLQAERVKVTGGGSAGEQRDIEGLVSACAALSNCAAQFSIGTQVIRTSSATRFENGSASLLAPNVRLNVSGTIATDMVLNATKISFKPQVRIQGPVAARSGSNLTLLGTSPGIVVTTLSSTASEDKRSSPTASSISAIAIGDYVTISAVRNGAQVSATRIEIRDPPSDARVRLRGLATAKTATNLSIEGITIIGTPSTDYESELDAGVDTLAELLDALRIGGDIVDVDGQLTGGQIVAEEVSIEGLADSN